MTGTPTYVKGSGKTYQPSTAHRLTYVASSTPNGFAYAKFILKSPIYFVKGSALTSIPMLIVGFLLLQEHPNSSAGNALIAIAGFWGFPILLLWFVFGVFGAMWNCPQSANGRIPGEYSAAMQHAHRHDHIYQNKF